MFQLCMLINELNTLGLMQGFVGNLFELSSLFRFKRLANSYLFKNNFLYISLFRSVLNDVLRGERVVVEAMTTERAWKRGTLQFLHIATTSQFGT